MSFSALAWHLNTTASTKVAVANSAVIAVGAISGPVVALNFSGRSRLPFLLILLAVGLLAILVANFLILRLAFRPLRELESMMGSVQPDVHEPRVHSSYADPDVRRITSGFHTKPDRMEPARHLTP